ncbi:MAG: alpha/beta fold hydrolase [Thermoflexales bacterium]|nr:alpha/beta fold hydrolase [Thermoflexales bacterium]
MKIQPFVLCLVLCSLIVSACATPPALTPAPTAAPTGVPRFEKEDCWFKEPASAEVECGFLIVPEDHAKPDGPTLKLAVARFRSDSGSPAPDPIVYLEGGPGGSPLRSLMPQFDVYLSGLLKKRDLILFDQRGTGYSQPALDCPESIQQTMDMLPQNLTPAQSEELSNKALLACRERLVKEGVNLAVFNSAQNAADIGALAQALNLQQVNLYGISYGTRLALTAMRDVPSVIRSVVIDSVYPPQVDLYSQLPVNGARAFEVLFKACTDDRACAAAFPDLKSEFFKLVDRLNTTPITMTITLHSGEQKEALMNGDGLVGLVFQSLYGVPIIPTLPRMIFDIRDGNYALAAGLQAEFLASMDNISNGMQYSVQCNEEVPFDTSADLDATLKQYPQYGALAAKGQYAFCSAWGVPTADAKENQAISSSIPTLVFSGGFDPITPPAWAELTASTLAQIYYFNLPRGGHGTSLSEECPRKMMLAFLDNPTAKPDAACIDESMVKTSFAIPLNPADIKLMAFTEAQLGISGVVPADWKKVSLGTYTPSGQLTDQSALLQQAGPIQPSMFLNLMKGQLAQSGIKTDFVETGTREANGLTWTLYAATVSIAGVDIAIAQADKLTYFVLLQSPITDRDVLYSAVFLPAVDALKSTK